MMATATTDRPMTRKQINQLISHAMHNGGYTRGMACEVHWVDDHPRQADEDNWHGEYRQMIDLRRTLQPGQSAQVALHTMRSPGVYDELAGVVVFTLPESLDGELVINEHATARHRGEYRRINASDVCR